jgi:hypothetical protein
MTLNLAFSFLTIAQDISTRIIMTLRVSINYIFCSCLPIMTVGLRTFELLRKD